MNFEEIDLQIDSIYNGTRDLPQFNQPEHAGVCSAGSLLIGALIVCNLARESLSTGANVDGSQTPSNWKIDQVQEQFLQKWAEYKGFWIPEAEQWLQANYGPMIAQGAEAKVYGRSGDSHVIKLRTSIYATLGSLISTSSIYNFNNIAKRPSGFAWLYLSSIIPFHFRYSSLFSELLDFLLLF